ncbi:polysaccharide biosynthesis tyrosine autokinase [Scytonema hofmannii FACHB-248]|uniref:Polysaccharide biosynthesis tyrosine autokinase n=1 Tax=Scytonema hofmannii FACHB-248 TaxID=1842502 RepID=A0ABR8GJ07_9CYAN|nr:MULTISPECIES: polysaccharide biosynthesis tyrosine autokinase [Nostocales]MBD2603160.1 polysaccharide biosynthesis tyrosine autokinase [Scytonema hofmannii FACHB-248]
MTMESLPNFEEIDVRKYLQVLQRRWLPVIGIFGISVSLGSLYAFSLKPSYKAEGSLMIKTNRTSSLTGLTQDIGRLEALNQNENPLETQVKIVTSNPVLQETIRLLNLKNAKGNPLPIRDFAAKLKVEGIKGSDVVQITYGDNNPELASKAVNTVINTYIKQNVQANQDEALTAKKFIEMQLPKAEGTVRRAESELREFKEKNKVIVLDQEANAAVDTISKLNSQVSQAQAQLDDVNGRLEQLRKQAQVDSQQGVIASELSQAPGVQKVLAQLQEAESQLTLERTRFQAGHPTVTNLEEKVAALRSLLQERTGQVAGEAQVTQGSLQIGQLRQGLIADITRAEAQRVGLERQIVTLSQQVNTYRQRASYLPRLEQFQRELERKLKAAQTTYEILLTKLQEISVAENQKIPNARVISYALIPDKPEGPRKLLFIVGGGAAGLFLGIITAFSLDLMDRSVKTVKEAKEVMRYTLLGIIPGLSINGKNHYSATGLNKSLPRIIGRDIPHFPFGDAYQILQANLKFLCSDKPLKSIVVSSSVAKEGKSEVAANLAVAMAQLGRRVLLVDADMRHPIQHHIWELTNAVGLSNIIVDQVSLNAAVQEVLPNLYVLSSGVLPPNPMALLDSQRMAILLNSFARDYDFVIFDTPALSGTADAAVLSNLTDGILLVVRPGVVNLDSANAAKEFLTQSGQKVLGIVINGVNVKREPDSYFYYTKDAIETAITSNNNSSLMREVDSR